jgi:hypothetical protein
VACLQRQTACVVCGHKRASWVDAEPVESLQCVVQRRTGVSNRRRAPPKPSTERHHGATQQVRTPGPAIPAREVSSVHGHVRGGKRQGMEAGWLCTQRVICGGEQPPVARRRVLGRKISFSRNTNLSTSISRPVSGEVHRGACQQPFARRRLISRGRGWSRSGVATRQSSPREGCARNQQQARPCSAVRPCGRFPHRPWHHNLN